MAEMLFARWIDTPIRPMLAVASLTHLHRLEFHDARLSDDETRRRASDAGREIEMGSSAALDQIEAELAAYFSGRSADFKTPLAIEGSQFEKKVWQRLLEVPLGETCSYGDIARDIDTIEAVRAVARANATNRIPIVIPCHRCIGSDGSLTGFGGGLWRKKWLLRHEGQMRPVGLFAL